MNIGEFFQLIQHCGCGSGLLSTWCKDEKGTDIKACDSCKPKLLYKIFDEKYMDLFEEWMGTLFNEKAAEGYEWVWEDLLKEKGCEQVVGLEGARNKLSQEQFMIPCPNGSVISMDPGDRTVHILVPKSYAELVLKSGKMDV